MDRKELRQVLRLPHIIALYLGSVIGSGILLIPGLTAELAGPASLIAWLAMSILVVPMAVTMGLLASRHPSSGGVSHFVRLAFGRHYGNLVGWLFLLSVPIGGPVLAVTGAQYVAVLLGWGSMETYILALFIFILPLVMNGFGLKLAGRVQMIVVALILGILLLAICTSVPHYDAAHFTPFLPHGGLSVFQAAALMFWCFIGWEAVTHLSAEFVDPKRNALRGVIWSAGIVAIIYFAVAFMNVATRSYGQEEGSATSLSAMVQLTLGPAGGWIVAAAALFICFAAHNAYSSAASRIALTLAREGAAPRWMGTLNGKYGTPVGGLGFIAAGGILALCVLGSGAVTLNELIALPNATFIATYVGGCLAGFKLLRDDRIGRLASGVSLVVTVALYPFLGWPAVYPLAVVAVAAFWRKRHTGWLARKKGTDFIAAPEDGEAPKL